GVSRELLDAAALVPPTDMYFLQPGEATKVRLENLTFFQGPWRLGAAHDAPLFAYNVQRNPITDNETTIYLTKTQGRIWLKIEFTPAPRWTRMRQPAGIATTQDLPGIFGEMVIELDGIVLARSSAMGWRSAPDKLWKAVPLSEEQLTCLTRGNILRVT